MASATSFVFSPKGPFSLAASIRFLEGFAPAAYDGESPANLEMAFCVDGYWDPVAVSVHENSDAAVGAVHGTVRGAGRLAPAVIAATLAQVERILSLDVDGRGYPDVARRDPVVARLQSRYIAEPNRGIEGDFKRFEIPVVNSYDLRAGIHRLIQLVVVVYFDQNRQRQRLGKLPQLPQLRNIEDCRNQQNRIRAVSSRLKNLNAVNDEIFAKHRQRHRRPRRLHVL